MKRTQKGLSLSALVCSLLLGACASEAPWSSDSETDGKISLRLATETNVVRPTRADDEHCSVIPGADEFSISLNGKSGSYSKTWSSSDAFNREGGFPMGSYTLSANYGDIESEGFSSPCFRGETDVIVEAGKESSSTVTATLANSMVSVRYTDKFMALFPQYTALLTSEGHNDPVVFVRQETRPAFVSPRPVHISLKLMNQQGNEKTVGAADFEAKPQHHHVITFDVQEEVGVSALNVIFEENVIAETNEIYLTDELFTTPAPQVSLNEDAKGGVSAFEYLPLSGKSPEMHVSAFGGIKSAVLTCVASDGGEAPFATLDLMKETDRAILDQYGIKASGFIAKKDDKGQDILNKMAVVGFAQLPKSHAELPQALKPGKYAFKLTVGDGSNIEVDPTEAAAVPELVINVTELKFTAEESATPKFLSDKVEVTVSSNCPYIADIVTLSLNGKVAKILNSSKIESSSPDMPYKYAYTLEYPGGKIEDTKCTFKAEAGLKTPIERTIDVEMPNYTVDVDAFAKKVLLRVNCDDAAVRKYIVNNLHILNGSNKINVGDIRRDDQNYIVEVKGLKPLESYSDFKVGLGVNNLTFITLPQFQCEEDENIPNNTFAKSETPWRISDIQVGSQFNNSGVKPYYTIKSGISVYEPKKWATINQLTAYDKASNKNTWYIVPSTLYDANDELIIRSVGYSHNGKDLKCSGGAFNTKYYGTTTPNDGDLTKAAGELFLGSYSYKNATETRTDGVDFFSRPSYMTLVYQYSSYNNEEGELSIRLIGEENEVLVNKIESLSNTASQRTVTIPFHYDFGKKVKKMELHFRSTKNGVIPSVKIPKDTELAEGGSGWNRTIPDNSYHALATGSVLKLISVSLEYDDLPGTKADKVNPMNTNRR